MQHPDILAFEQRSQFDTTQAAAFLGVAYPTYTAYKATRKPLSPCFAAHLRTLMRLPDDVFLAVLRG